MEYVCGAGLTARKISRGAKRVSSAICKSWQGIGQSTAIAPELSRYQPVRRDFVFRLRDAVRWQLIADALHDLHIAELTRFAPREIFRASQALPRRHYSILIRITFQALERTLREEELQSYSQAVIAAPRVLGWAARA